MFKLNMFKKKELHPFTQIVIKSLKCDSQLRDLNQHITSSWHIQINLDKFGSCSFTNSGYSCVNGVWFYYFIEFSKHDWKILKKHLKVAAVKCKTEWISYSREILDQIKNK